jgi:hypothetical protein
MPADTTGDDIGAPQLCPFCIERLARAAEHGHVDQDWADRAAKDFARACCTRDRSLR